MSRKSIGFWAVIMIVVFGLTVVVYPLIFNTENGGMSKVETGPEPVSSPALGH